MGSLLLCGLVASSVFPAPCSRLVSSGSTICGRKLLVFPTTSSHEPPSASVGVQGGLQDPSGAPPLTPRWTLLQGLQTLLIILAFGLGF